MRTVSHQEAVREWQARQVGAPIPGRFVLPDGAWWPHRDERQRCCGWIKPPTKARPFTLLEHCRGAQHIATKYRISERSLRAAIKEGDTGGEFYVIAVDRRGQLLSIFEPEVEYRLGETGADRQPMKGRGGYLVFKTVADAMFAKANGSVLDRVTLESWPKRIVKVRAEGALTRFKSNLIFSRITPLEVVNVTQADVVNALDERGEA